MLLLFFSVPVLLSAQNDDPRIRQVAPAPGVQSMSVKTVRYWVFKAKKEERTPAQIRSGLHTKEYRMHVDSTARAINYYSPDGNVDSSYFKYYHPVSSSYHYLNDTSWVCISTRTWRIDSTIVTGNTAKTVPAERGDDYYRALYRGDSMHYVYYNSKGERRTHYDYCTSPADSFWDYRSAGTFAKKVVVHTGNRDTVSYLDAKGKWMVKVVNEYDSAGHPVVSHYFNRSVKDFDLITMWANHHIGDATVYLPRNGDRMSCAVYRTFDTRGLLQCEEWHYHNVEMPVARKFYTYTFWP